MNDAEVRLQIKIDDSTAIKSVDTLSKKTESLSKSFSNAGKTLTAGLTIPITALGTLAIKSASDLQETMNKVDVAFGNSSDSVKEWGNTTIKQFGIAKGTALDMTALFGDMATGMGVNQQEASKLSMNLTGLAGDLASFKNISLDVAKTALAGVFTGETESLKQLGIIMTQTNLEQYALSQGITKSMDEMTEAEKIQLRYAFVVDRSKNAVGDFARTSDSTANQARTASETFKELSAEVGEKLLPQFNKLLSTGLNIMNWFKNLTDEQKNMIITVVKLVAILGPLLLIIGKGIELFLKIQKVAKALNMTTLAFSGTIGLIVIAIIALIAIIYLLVKNWDKIKEVVGNSLNAIGNFFKNIWNNIKTFFSNIFSAIGTFFSNVWNSIVSFMTPIINFIAGIFTKIGEIIMWPINFIKNAFILIIALVAMYMQFMYNLIMPIVLWIYNNILLPIFNFFVSIFTAIGNFIMSYIEFIKNTFLTIVSFIWNNILNPIFSFFGQIFGAIWNVISNVIENVKGGFQTAVDFIMGIFEKLRDAISFIFRTVGNIIKAPINGVITLINGVLKNLNKIKVPDWVPGIGGTQVNFPMIPQLSVGTNMVAQEGLAYLHQGEAVVPKKYNPAIGGNATQTIYIDVPTIEMDGKAVAKTTTPYMVQVLKQGGAR